MSQTLYYGSGFSNPLTQLGLSLPQAYTAMPCPHPHAGGNWLEVALMLG